MPVVPSAAIENPSKQLQAVLKWAEGMATANFDILGAVLADDYVHTALPANLSIPVLGSKEHFIKHYQGVLPIFSSFDVSVHEVVEAPGRVVLHAAADAMTKPGFPYINEYILIFHVAEQPDGSFKLTSAKEFVDSKFTAGFMEQLQKVLAPSS
ncbi:hypothetical protein BXZ70DRAFT_910293 [Cristinia sonorae]|uniref:SnoaL-like domain-containing protein n=1 Tax=Cristinia sonorae TaxID=1940300 RepID=A0A8K0UI74_9AGAR|nr:hypothetical protein BXZ70DRAFT_910293 [Cristinia sonorae]